MLRPAVSTILSVVALLLCLQGTTANAAPLRPSSYTLTGTVYKTEPNEQRWRLYVRPHSLHNRWRGDVSKEDLPRMVRITYSRRYPLPPVGAVITAPVKLAPPRPPVMPGAFDYQEYLWRRGVDATGFVFGQPVVTAHEPTATIAEKARRHLHRLRQYLAYELQAFAPANNIGAVMAALVTGERGYIDWQTEEEWRRSGITHLLSISGTHIGLLIGFVFVTVRGLLALTPLVLRYPVKKWAAVLGWLVAGFYTILAGADVPTVRSYLMASVVLLGMLLERRALSLWTLALAAVAILAVQPHAVFTPGFQYSFAAVAVLIVFFRWQERWPLRQRFHGAGTAGRWGWYAIGLVLSGLLLTLVTAPVALYHFQQLALYGALANLLAIPLTGIVVMPALLLAMLAWPFGLQHLPLQAAAKGTAALNTLARSISDWPLASVSTAWFSGWAVLLFFGGCALLYGLRGRYKMLSAAPILAAMMLMLRPLPAQILLDGEGKQSGFYRDGQLWVSGNADSFLASAWGDRLGVADIQAVPKEACDSIGCRFTFAGTHIALAETAQALRRDCAGADVIITPLTLSPPPGCTVHFHDKKRQRQQGAALYYPVEKTLQTDAAHRNNRPWSPYR